MKQKKGTKAEASQAQTETATGSGTQEVVSAPKGKGKKAPPQPQKEASDDKPTAKGAVTEKERSGLLTLGPRAGDVTPRQKVYSTIVRLVSEGKGGKLSLGALIEQMKDTEQFKAPNGSLEHQDRPASYTKGYVSSLVSKGILARV